MRTTPPATTPAVRERMRAQKTRDTAPELALRSELHRLGLRYRKNARPLAGSRCNADVVFTRARVAVFVDGCFWHGCDEHRPTRILAGVNREWWAEKIGATRERDERYCRELAAAGWRVVRLWEHEVRADAAACAERVRLAVAGA